MGVVLSLASVVLLSMFQSYVERGQEEAISDAVHTFVVQSMNDNAAAALAQWDLQGHPITVEQVGAFGHDVEERFGSFKSLRVGKVNPAADMSLLKAGLDAWLIFGFRIRHPKWFRENFSCPQSRHLLSGDQVHKVFESRIRTGYSRFHP